MQIGSLDDCLTATEICIGGAEVFSALSAAIYKIFIRALRSSFIRLMCLRAKVKLFITNF